MRKILMLFLLIGVMFWGCNGVQIDGSATHQAISYGAGKAMGIGINELVPVVDPDLSRAWTDLMQANAGHEAIAPETLLVFYNDMIKIISAHTADPYGLIGDLGVLLVIFGAQYDPGGAMVSIDPVPMKIMRMFEQGYVNGRRVVIRSGT